MHAAVELLEWSPGVAGELRALVDQMPAGDTQSISVLDSSLQFVAATPSAAEFLGVPLDRLLGADFTQVDFVGCDVEGRLLRPDDHPAAVALRSQEPVLGAVVGFEPRGGSLNPFRWFSMDVWPMAGGSGEVVGVVAHVDDITGSEAAALATSQVVRNYRQVLATTRENEVRFRALAENSADVVYQTDIEARVVWISPSVTHHLGWEPRDLVGRRMPELIHPEDLTAAQERRAQALADGSGLGRIELRYLTADGDWRWMGALSRPMHDAAGRITGGLTALRDVHSDVAQRSELEYLAAHDGLTGLLNRTAVEQRLARELVVARASDRWVGVLYLDLDGFKDVNDAHGHAAGDRVLVDLSHQLVASLRDTDAVARLGGDEFLVVLPGMRDESHVERRARALIGGLASRHVPGVPKTTISVGIAADRGHGDVHQVIDAADAALFRAKQSGKDCVAW